jgi:hypothetical protein
MRVLTGVGEMMYKLGFAGVLMIAIASTAGAQQQPPKTQPDTILDSQRPPKGMCRIWLKDVPAAQQPAPTDCTTAVKNVPANGKVIFGDTQGSKKPTLQPKPLVDPKQTTPPVKPPFVRKPPGG